MKKLKTQALFKFLVIFVILAGFLISGKIIYDNLLRATKINLSLVETYRPHLDVGLVKKAAGVLQEKSDQFKETSVSPKEEETSSESKEEVEIKEEKESSEEAVLEESKEASPEAEISPSHMSGSSKGNKDSLLSTSSRNSSGVLS